MSTNEASIQKKIFKKNFKSFFQLAAANSRPSNETTEFLSNSTGLVLITSDEDSQEMFEENQEIFDQSQKAVSDIRQQEEESSETKEEKTNETSTIKSPLVKALLKVKQ